jgi:ADP-heptose:LPS heptosyltransferase
MHILVFKQGGMGDLLMASPGLRALRKSLPQAHISFAVGRSNSRVLDNNPYIDELIEFDDDYIFKIGRFNQIKQAFRLWRRVRRLRPDAVVILHRDLRWNLLFFLAGVPNRYGFDRYLNGAFLTKSAPALAEGHEIEKYLRVFALVDGFQADGLIMDLFPTTEDEKIVENLLAPHIGGTMVALAPGGAQNIKESRDLSRWPLDRYRTLVEKILAQTNLTVVLIGGPDDRKWTESLCLDENRVMDTAGPVDCSAKLSGSKGLPDHGDARLRAHAHRRGRRNPHCRPVRHHPPQRQSPPNRSFGRGYLEGTGYGLLALLPRRQVPGLQPSGLYAKH